MRGQESRSEQSQPGTQQEADDEMSPNMLDRTGRVAGHTTASRETTSLGHYAYRFFDSIGLITVHRSPVDAKLILVQRFVRVFGYGLVALSFAAYLSALGFSDTQIGVFFGLTLVGDFFMVLFLTQFAHVIGLKVVLVVGAALMTMSGLVFTFSGSYWVLLAAAIFGVLSPRWPFSLFVSE